MATADDFMSYVSYGHQADSSFIKELLGVGDGGRIAVNKPVSFLFETFFQKIVLYPSKHIHKQLSPYT